MNMRETYILLKPGPAGDVRGLHETRFSGGAKSEGEGIVGADSNSTFF